VLVCAAKLLTITVSAAVVTTMAVSTGAAADPPPAVASSGAVANSAIAPVTPPVCLPGQEPNTRSGSGTPAPLGNLQGLPADLKDGGTFGGVALDGGQTEMAAVIVAVGKQMGITRRGIEIGLSVATEQSSLRPEALNKDWLGLFQQNPRPIPSTGGPNPAAPRGCSTTSC